ncbi:MAG: hypothetical protein ACLQF1_03370 [Methyloceanibacter sp.]|jgi:hypothetical protein
MAAVGEPELSSVPGMVFTPRQVRILKLAVIVMGILLVGGFAFVLAAIVYQASRSAQGVGASAPLMPGQGELSIDLPVPRDATLAGVSLDGNQLAVQLNGNAGPEIAVIDLASGKIVARVRLKPQ